MKDSGKYLIRPSPLKGGLASEFWFKPKTIYGS